jgi:hypothetical protein
MTSLSLLGLLGVLDSVRGMDSETQHHYKVFKEIWDHKYPRCYWRGCSVGKSNVWAIIVVRMSMIVLKKILGDPVNNSNFILYCHLVSKCIFQNLNFKCV